MQRAHRHATAGSVTKASKHLGPQARPAQQKQYERSRKQAQRGPNSRRGSGSSFLHARRASRRPPHRAVCTTRARCTETRRRHGIATCLHTACVVLRCMGVGQQKCAWKTNSRESLPCAPVAYAHERRARNRCGQTSPPRDKETRCALRAPRHRQPAACPSIGAAALSDEAIHAPASARASAAQQSISRDAKCTVHNPF
jgi:hypothetical protein